MSQPVVARHVAVAVLVQFGVALEVTEMGCVVDGTWEESPCCPPNADAKVLARC